jgi:hypothetical protein
MKKFVIVLTIWASLATLGAWMLYSQRDAERKNNATIVSQANEAVKQKEFLMKQELDKKIAGVEAREKQVWEKASQIIETAKNAQNQLKEAGNQLGTGIKEMEALMPQTEPAPIPPSAPTPAPKEAKGK